MPPVCPRCRPPPHPLPPPPALALLQHATSQRSNQGRYQNKVKVGGAHRQPTTTTTAPATACAQCPEGQRAAQRGALLLPPPRPRHSSSPLPASLLAHLAATSTSHTHPHLSCKAASLAGRIHSSQLQPHNSPLLSLPCREAQRPCIASNQSCKIPSLFLTVRLDDLNTDCNYYYILLLWYLGPPASLRSWSGPLLKNSAKLRHGGDCRSEAALPPLPLRRCLLIPAAPGWCCRDDCRGRNCESGCKPSGLITSATQCSAAAPRSAQVRVQHPGRPGPR